LLVSNFEKTHSKQPHGGSALLHSQQGDACKRVLVLAGVRAIGGGGHSGHTGVVVVVKEKGGRSTQQEDVEDEDGDEEDGGRRERNMDGPTLAVAPTARAAAATVAPFLPL